MNKINKRQEFIRAAEIERIDEPLNYWNPKEPPQPPPKEKITPKDAVPSEFDSLLTQKNSAIPRIEQPADASTFNRNPDFMF